MMKTLTQLARILTTLSLLTMLTVGQSPAIPLDPFPIPDDPPPYDPSPIPDDPPPQNVQDPTPVPAGEHLEVVRVNSNMGTCTGILIAPDAVLTAGHCFCSDSVIGGNICNTRATVVFSSFESIDGDVEVHAGYNPTLSDGIDDDIALVHLDTPSSRTPVRVGRSSLAVGTEIKLVGFGRTGSDCLGSSGTKNFELTTIDDYEDSYEKIVYDQDISCGGDSGGGVYDRSGIELYGIHSGDYWLGGLSIETVAMNVPHYYSWIKARVCSTNFWHACDASAPICRCERTQGDCDISDDCRSPYKCRQNVGSYYGFSASADVCLLENEPLPNLCDIEDCNK